MLIIRFVSATSGSYLPYRNENFVSFKQLGFYKQNIAIFMPYVLEKISLVTYKITFVRENILCVSEVISFVREKVSFVIGKISFFKDNTSFFSQCYHIVDSLLFFFCRGHIGNR